MQIRKKRRSAILIGLILLILACFFLLVENFSSFGNKESFEQANQLEERDRIQPPQNWMTYNIEHGVSISVPPDWFFVNAPDGCLANIEKGYIISNLRELIYCDDWNVNEEVRIYIHFSQSGNFDERIKGLTAAFRELSARNTDGAPDERLIFSHESYLINGHRASHFLIEGGKLSVETERLLVELSEGTVLEIVVDLKNDVPTDQITIYKKRFQTILDSVLIV